MIHDLSLSGAGVASCNLVKRARRMQFGGQQDHKFSINHSLRLRSFVLSRGWIYTLDAVVGRIMGDALTSLYLPTVRIRHVVVGGLNVTFNHDHFAASNFQTSVPLSSLECLQMERAELQRNQPRWDPSG
jgi:hypothetical protein